MFPFKKFWTDEKIKEAFGIGKEEEKEEEEGFVEKKHVVVAEKKDVAAEKKDVLEEKMDEDLAECSWSWFTCDVDVTGWVGSVPSYCGDIGEYVNDDDHCSNSLGIAGCGIDEGLYPYTQSCR